jgi:ABC-2 type transport system ATP-binding protein
MKSKIDKDYFRIKGVSELEADGRTISFLFKGNINMVMKKFVDIEVSNVWIEEPTLEEIFMNYYEKEE